MNDAEAEKAVKRRRHRLMISILELVLGDLVGLVGIPQTKKILARFQSELENY